jgi:hypothetical protein
MRVSTDARKFWQPANIFGPVIASPEIEAELLLGALAASVGADSASRYLKALQDLY